MRAWGVGICLNNCSWFHWKSVTQLERESGFSESLSCSVLTEHAFFAHHSAVMLFQLLQLPCQCLWQSLAMPSLFYSTVPDWLVNVCDSRQGSRRKMHSLKVRCISWDMREHMWMSLHWLLFLVSLLLTRSKHWPSVSFLLFPLNLTESIHPSFFRLQLSKDLLFLVVATKSQTFL